MMEVVRFSNVAESFKLALNEVLASYFDGNSHTINDQALTFPNPELSYDARFLTTPPFPLSIAIVGIGSSKVRESKFTNPQKQNDPGVELLAEVTRHVYITAQVQNDTSGMTRKLVDETYGLLFAVFNGDYKSFADRGILRPDFPPIPSDVTVTQHLVQAYSVLKCTLRTTFARHNTT